MPAVCNSQFYVELMDEWLMDVKTVLFILWLYTGVDN